MSKITYKPKYVKVVSDFFYCGNGQTTSTKLPEGKTYELSYFYKDSYILNVSPMSWGYVLFKGAGESFEMNMKVFEKILGDGFLAEVTM